MITIGPDDLAKNIRQEIKRGLKSGQSKQNLFAEFRTEENESQLRRFLAKFPDSRPETIFKVLNIIVYVIWSILLLGSFTELFEKISLGSILTLVVVAFITIEIIKFNGYIYLPAIIFLILNLIQWCFEVANMIKTSEFNEEGTVEMTYFISVIFIMAIIIMIIIRKKIFGYYNWFLPFKDSNGQYIFDLADKN